MTPKTDREQKRALADEAANLASMVRLQLSEIAARVSSDHELLDVLHATRTAVKEIERGRRKTAASLD